MSSEHRVLICGDRNWNDPVAIHLVLTNMRAALSSSTSSKQLVVIEGEAKGADSLAREVALRLGLKVLKFPAQWEKFGRAAGPIRNTQMLEEGKPDVVVAFHDNLEASKGTKNMVNQALKAGILTFLFSHGMDAPLQLKDNADGGFANW